MILNLIFFFFSSRRRHTISDRDWSSDVCSSDLASAAIARCAIDALDQLRLDTLPDQCVLAGAGPNDKNFQGAPVVRRRLLPLDGAGRFARDVEHDPVDAFD